MNSNSKKIKMGLIGWWGGKNEGDAYILQTLEKALSDDFIVYPIETPFKITWKTKLRLNRLDFLLVGGGGLFTITPPTPFNTFDKWGERIKTPIGFLGVGVQEIKPEYEGIIKQIVEKSVFFIVRDTESLELAKQFSPKVIKAPDLTFLYPRYISRKPVAETIGVNLRVWNFDKYRTYDNSAWCRAINALPWVKETVPLSFLEGLHDSEAMKGIEGKQNATFDIRIYERMSIFIGMRLHSLIFAVQNSIPIIGIAYTPKVRRFFREIGLEEFCLGLEEYNRLNKVFHEVLKRYEEISEILEKYTHNSKAALTKQMENVKGAIKGLQRDKKCWKP